MDFESVAKENTDVNVDDQIRVEACAGGTEGDEHLTAPWTALDDAMRAQVEGLAAGA